MDELTRKYLIAVGAIAEGSNINWAIACSQAAREWAKTDKNALAEEKANLEKVIAEAQAKLQTVHFEIEKQTKGTVA